METVPVSTTVSGIPELIENKESGLLVEPGNIKDLSEMLVGYLQDEYEIPQSNPRKRVLADFDVRMSVDELIKSIRSC